MCDKCEAIDEKIWRYRRVARQIDDQQIHEVADRLAERLDAQKLAFHAR
jgi:hypothetical protein